MDCFCFCFGVATDEDDILIVRNLNRTSTNLGDSLDFIVEHIRIWPPTRISHRSTSQCTRIWPPARTILTSTCPQASSATSRRAAARAQSDTVPLSVAPSFLLVNDGAAETKQSGEGGKSGWSDIKGKPKMVRPLSFSNLNSQVGGFYELLEVDEDVCPTCLEEYTEENPKITAHCSHNFHLACILAWQERSEECPVCRKLMIFNERSEPIFKNLNESYF